MVSKLWTGSFLKSHRGESNEPFPNPGVNVVCAISDLLPVLLHLLHIDGPQLHGPLGRVQKKFLKSVLQHNDRWGGGGLVHCSHFSF